MIFFYIQTYVFTVGTIYALYIVIRINFYMETRILCRKDLLDKAFAEATSGININSINDTNILIEVLATSMRAFAEREKVDFTDSEIRATIIVELEPILALSNNFVYPSDIMMF